MKNKSFNSILSLILTLTSFYTASVHAEKLNFNISANRLISLDLTKPSDSNLPTFLFLPGVNRGLLSDEAALVVLKQKGFGVVTMNFSTQPFSVSELASDVSPEFLSKSYTLEELGNEVVVLSNELKKNFNIQNIIPVSISYSSAVSSTIKGFSLMIDAAPMTSSAAVNPQLENYRATLKASEIFNPIYGPGITRSLLDQTYYTTWTPQVEAMIKQFQLNADRKPDMIKGYTVQSRAAEGFTWDLKKTNVDTKRIFILGKKDSKALLKNQLEVVLKALENEADVLVFVVNEAGHIIPSDQPQTYAAILTYVATNDIENSKGVFEVQGNDSEPKFHSGAEAKKYIQELIKSL
jgi:hypothetical protein